MKELIYKYFIDVQTIISAKRGAKVQKVIHIHKIYCIMY